MALYEARPANDLDQPFGESGGIVWLPPGNLYNREFIAAQSRNYVCVPRALAQPIRDAFEQSVSYGVSQRIIDALESIKVNKKDGQRLAAAPYALQSLVQLPSEQNAISQARQGVVMGNMVCFTLQPFTLSYFVSQLLVSADKLACALPECCSTHLSGAAIQWP